MKPYTITIAVLALIAVACFYLWGYSNGRRQSEDIVVSQVDTLIIRDTLRIEKPVEVAHNIIREKVVEIPVYISTKDTVIQKVYIPREERIYKDSAYFAVVSGVEPKLDYLEVYQKEVVRMVDREVKVKSKWSWGLQGGFGVVAPVGQKITAGGYIGIGGLLSF